MTDYILVLDCKLCPVRSRPQCSKQNWFTPSFLEGGWAGAYGTYCVGISCEVLKAERAMPAKELDSSSCLLCGKYKLQILFEERGFVVLLFPKWLFAPSFGQFASSCCPLCCDGCCLYICICFCELVYLKMKSGCVHHNKKNAGINLNLKNAGILLIVLNPLYCIFRSCLTVLITKLFVCFMQCLFSLFFV